MSKAIVSLRQDIAAHTLGLSLVAQAGSQSVDIRIRTEAVQGVGCVAGHPPHKCMPSSAAFQEAPEVHRI